MRVVAICAYGGPEALQPMEMPAPVPATGETLVRVRAAGVNPADGKWRAGMFASFAPIDFPHVPGYDVAGEVVTSDRFAAGSRVLAMLDPFRKGGYAELAVVADEAIAEMPPELSYPVAAALPTPGLTGLQIIERALDVRGGERLLITGATGAVGRVALHTAKARGAHVVAAVRESQREEALRLGANAAYTLSGPKPEGLVFDAVADTVGGDDVGRWCRAVVPGGRIVTAATTPIPADDLETEPRFFAVVPDGADLARLTDLVAQGDILVVVAAILPLADAAEAQRRVEAGGAGGKLILEP